MLAGVRLEHFSKQKRGDEVSSCATDLQLGSTEDVRMLPYVCLGLRQNDVIDHDCPKQRREKYNIQQHVLTLSQQVFSLDVVPLKYV